MKLFLTGGTGFMGREVLRVVAADHPEVRVLALGRSSASRARLAELGAEPVEGDLSTPGAWQEVAADADLVLHAAQPQAWGQKVTPAVAAGWEAARLVQEANLLGALRSGQRVVYVSGSSWFGHTGPEPKDETMTPSPCGWGPYLRRPLAQAADHAERGLDLVIAYPSSVYGPGSWFEQLILRPLAKGRRLYTLWGSEPWVSPIHVEDCARALLHLALVDRGALDEVGRHVLLVDDEPLATAELIRLAADALGVQARSLPVPGPIVRLLAGEVVRSYLASQACYRNGRLEALGFALRWPTARAGVPAVVEAWRAGRDG